MAKVKLTITESQCRGMCCSAGNVFPVEDLCPPLCHELRSSLYPQVHVLQNGGRVSIHGEVICDEET